MFDFEGGGGVNPAGSQSIPRQHRNTGYTTRNILTLYNLEIPVNIRVMFLDS